MKEITHWIGGKPWAGTSARVGDVVDPATGTVTGRVHLGGASEVDAAVASAHDAFSEWGHTPLSHRTALLFRCRELVDEHRDDLVSLLVSENGKTTSDAAGEVQRGLEVVEFACGIAHLLKGEHTAGASRGVDTHGRRQPLGVVAGITPFNFPAMVPMWMFPLAIACGNTFVLKPSERVPSAAVRLAELWYEAGLPEGVFNVVTGDRDAADALLAHPRITAVSFVGSTPAARHVHATAARHGKRVQALGGAKNHMIVLQDADPEAAADAAVSAAFGAAGQRCMAISVLVAVGSIADDLVDHVRRRARALQVGPGIGTDVDMGPLISQEHRDRVASHLEGAAADGATLVLDGRNIGDLPGGGFWLGPSLVDHVTPAMAAYQEEIFGPVLCVVRVDTFDDALALVNANPYGNGAALFTRDGRAARIFEEEVSAGMVGINVPIPVPVAYHPFGGWGDSLFGDTHVHGLHGVHFYTRQKVVTSRWLDSSSNGPSFAFPST